MIVWLSIADAELPNCGVRFRSYSGSSKDRAIGFVPATFFFCLQTSILSKPSEVLCVCVAMGFRACNSFPMV